MITVKNTVLRPIKNFWNGCVFHPTDAIEDPWGKRILDQMAADKAIRMVRIYNMLEDIVYLDAEGNLQYDFRLNDLRLDYLVEKGYDIMIAYAAVPDCISLPGPKASNSKNKTRYKGKLFNTMPPKDYSLWEEVCYQYTRHIVDRYGIDTVSRWYLHCFNEPDILAFFLADTDRQDWEARLRAYCPMYEHFTKGLLRVSDRLHMGGPALATWSKFLGGFLDFVREKQLRLDYIALHHYGTTPTKLNAGDEQVRVENNLRKHGIYMDVIREHGFHDTEVVVDEWGAASAGFYNREECPQLMFREHEVYSAYFGKLIYCFLHSDMIPGNLMICLSGQHEMTEDFSGFRNFFTLNFMKKPIYNAFVLANRLGEQLLDVEAPELVHAIPTKTESGYAMLLTYCDDTFTEALPTVEETVVLPDTVREITLWCIDKTHTNPYRLFETGVTDVAQLRQAGLLKPVAVTPGHQATLQLTPNCLWLIEGQTR